MITLPASHFAALLHLAPRSDVRCYLNGIYVEATATETRCVATDGHVLGVLRSTPVTENTPGKIIVPHSTATFFSKSAGVLTLNTDQLFAQDGVRCTFKPVEGQFPDYRRIFPTATNGLAAQFDPILLGRLVKTCKVLGGGHVWLAHNGQNANLVRFTRCVDFAGVIMPLADKGQPEHDIEWVKK